MTDIAIDLEPDPRRDAAARRAALALVAAGQDEDQEVVHEQSGAVLHDLVSAIVGQVDVRPESAPALEAMLTTAARQFTAFAALTYVVAQEAFLAGQESPNAPGLDIGALLSGVSDVLGQIEDEQGL